MIASSVPVFLKSFISSYDWFSRFLYHLSETVIQKKAMHGIEGAGKLVLVRKIDCILTLGE